jgi:hypothetical protein
MQLHPAVRGTLKWGTLILCLYSAFVTFNCIFLLPYPWDAERIVMIFIAALTCGCLAFGFSRFK